MKRTILKLLMAILIIPVFLWGVGDNGVVPGTKTTPHVSGFEITVTAGNSYTISKSTLDDKTTNFTPSPDHIEISNLTGFTVTPHDSPSYSITVSPPASTAAGDYIFKWQAQKIIGGMMFKESNYATVTVHVTRPTTPPTILDIHLGYINENTNVLKDLSGHITRGSANVSYINIVSAEKYPAIFKPDSFNYKNLLIQSPNVNANKKYTVTYVACDVNDLCSPTPKIIDFTAMNKTPPQTRDLSFTYEKDSGTKTINIRNYAIKTEGDAISDASLSSAHAFITLNGAHTQISVNTNSAPVGTHTATWRAGDTDGWSLNPPSTITITITPKTITAPHADDISITVDEGKSTTKHMWEGITVHTNPIKTINFRGTIPRYMELPSTNITAICDATASPEPDDQGTKSFLWQVCDNATPSNCSNWASFTVTVNDVPPPSAGGYDIYMEKGTTLKDDDIDSRGTRVSPAWHADGTRYQYQHSPSYMGNNDRGYINLHPSSLDDTYFEYRVYRNGTWTPWTKVNVHVTNPPPPDLSGVTEPTVRVRFKKEKNYDLLHYVQGTNGNNNVDQVKFAPVPHGLQNFITLNNSGVVNLAPTRTAQVGNHTVTWKAHNPRGGWSTTTKNLYVQVWEGTPPVASDKNLTVYKGNFFDFKLLDSGAISETDGDAITKYHIWRRGGEPRDNNVRISKTLASHGRIWGTPDKVGTFHFRFKAEDFDGQSRLKTFTLIVKDGTPPTTYNVKKTVDKGNYFEWYLDSPTGGVTKTEGNRILEYKYTGTIPGVRLDGRTPPPNGNFRSRPTTLGDYNITFEAKDANGWSAPAIFTLHVVQGPPPTTQSGTVTATRGRSYDCGLDLIKGDPCGSAFIQKTRNSIREYEINGTIPGMSIRQGSSIIVGTPTTEGNYTLNFRARDDDGWSNPATLDFIVPGEPPVINVPDFNYTIGRSPTLNIDLSNYASDAHGDSISYSWLSGTLPAGMSWNGAAPSTTVYEDAEDGRADRWEVYTGGGAGVKIENIYDPSLQSRVIHTVAPNGTSNGFRLGASGLWPRSRSWKNSTQKIVSWTMKTSVWYTVYIAVKTKEHGYGYIYYTPTAVGNNGIPSGTWGGRTHPEYVYNGLGYSSKNGTWQTFTRDLEVDLKKVQPNNEILEVYGFLARGDCYFDNISLSDATTSSIGIFSGDPTEDGNFTIGVGATDKDGMSIDNFNINVIQPVPPKVHNKRITIDEGSSLTYDLLARGAVEATDGDAIDTYEINTTVPGISFNTATGKFTGTATTAGEYDVGFRAHDLDNWSNWGILHIKVSQIHHTSDLCFVKLSSSNYAGDCKTDIIGEYRGGIGCEQTIEILNQSNKTLTDVQLALNHTAPYNVTYAEYGKDGRRIGDGSHQAVFNFGTFSFNKGTKFDMSNFAASGTRKIYTKKSSTSDATITKPVFNGNNLYIKYKKDGEQYISKVQKCVIGYDKDLDIDADYNLIYGGPGNAVLGDVAATAESVLFVTDPVNDSYAGNLPDSTTSYILDDASFNTSSTDARKHNASSSALKLPYYVKGRHIKWAGLFWQGYVHTPQGTTLAPTTVANMHTTVDGWNKVRLKTPDGVYHDIEADKSTKDMNNSTYYYGMVDNNSSRFFYSSYKEITDLVRDTYTESNNTFTVGNIMTTAGKDYADSLYVSHANNDAGQWNTESTTVGYFGGWSIVVVYDLIGTPEALDTSITDVYKNVSLYNGYDMFMTWGDGNVEYKKEVALSGFRTPGSGRVDSRMIFFGAGADQTENADTLQIQQKKTASFDNIFNTLNPFKNQFNSTCTKDNTELNSTKTYHHGIDLDIYDVSSSMDHNQSATKIQFGTKKIGTNSLKPNAGHSDMIFPQLVGLSTKLYIPEICYDFDVKIGNYISIDTTEDRIFTASKINSEPLMVKILLKSEQSDFDLINSQGKIDFNSSTLPLSFNAGESKVSPPSVHAYLDAVSGDAGSDYITLGEGYTNASGGIIEPNVANYAQFAFDFTGDRVFITQFDIQLSTAIQFSSSSAPIPYILTSAGSSGSFGHIDRCERNKVYDPVLGSFNIERGTVHRYTNPRDTYPLYTQITGRDFNVSLVSYTGKPAYNTETATDTTVELEVINAGSFDNNASTGFDSVCEDPGANMGKGALFNFGGNSRVPVSIPTQLPDYQKDVALQNAAFRIWVLTQDDGNGTRAILHYNETDKTNFKRIYDTYYRNNDDNTTHYCVRKCASNDGTDGCYDCLKKYFSTPVCSRDNFAIRPESYKITLGDNNQNDMTSPNYLGKNDATSINVAAGYKYRVDINTTLLHDTGTARGYYHHFKPVSNFSALSSAAVLEFNTTGTCADTANDSFDIGMINGETLGVNYLKHDNVGDYDFWLIDANWTKVDQGQYLYKKRFGDCGVGDTRAICNDCLKGSFATTAEGTQVGCTLYSDHDNIHYKKMELSFKPYRFNLDDIALANNPAQDRLFMNDFSSGYFSDLIQHPIKMASTFDGNITALGFAGGSLSNFTDSCVAADVVLRIVRETEPSEDALEGLDAAYPEYVSHPVKLQQYLQDTRITKTIPSVNRLEGQDQNATLLKEAFLDENNGSARVIYHASMKKEERAPTNPIEVEYKKLTAEGNASISYANMGNHIPKGENIYDKNTTFFYGKVSPKRRFYEVDTNDTKTPLFVDIYCDHNQTFCRDQYDLNNSHHTEDEPNEWYLANNFSQLELSNSSTTTDLNTTLDSGSNAGHGVAISQILSPIGRGVNIQNVEFDDDPATQKDVNVSVTGSARPSIIKVQYNPVPWLIFDPVTDFYRVKFIGISDWSGIGKTGHVTDINSSRETQHRMNW